MPASLADIPDLNVVFNLNSFCGDLKKIISIILDNLGELNTKFDGLKFKVDHLPEVPDVGNLLI